MSVEDDRLLRRWCWKRADRKGLYLGFFSVQNIINLIYLPKAGAEPEEQEETVALSEAGQEGEEQVDGENVDQTLPPAHLITQTPPHQRPHHHGHVHQQTCRNTNTQSSAVSLARQTPNAHQGAPSPLCEPD